MCAAKAGSNGIRANAGRGRRACRWRGRAVERAVEFGATVARPRVDLPQGSVAVIDDPTGATLALWEPKPETHP
jgi:hypothetical protein